jgi:hypothetical protein
MVYYLFYLVNGILFILFGEWYIIYFILVNGIILSFTLILKLFYLVNGILFILFG